MSDFTAQSTDMALDFPGWRARQPAPVQAQIDDYLNAVSDRPAAERRLTNTVWFSEQTDHSLTEVDENYDVFRASLGAQLHWGDDWKDDTKIFTRIHDGARRTRSLEKSLFPAAGTDEATQAANKNTMLYWADEAARKGQDSATAFQEWRDLPETLSSEGVQHAQQSGEGLYTPFYEWYTESDRQWRAREAKADEVIKALSKEMNNGEPFFSGVESEKLIDSLPPDEQQTILRLVIERARAKEKGGLHQAGEAFFRPMAVLGEKLAGSTVNRVEMFLDFREGMTIKGDSDEIDRIKKASAEEQGRFAVQQKTIAALEAESGSGRGIGELWRPSFDLSKEAAAAANKAANRVKHARDLTKQLAEIARNDIDPVAGWNRDVPGTGWFAQHVTYPALSLFGTALTFEMPGGFVSHTIAAAETEKDRLRHMGVDKDTAALQGGLSGVVQTMLFAFGPRMLAKVPGFKWLGERAGPPPAGLAGALGQRLLPVPGRAAVGAGFMTAAGVTPLMLQNAFSRIVEEEPFIPWAEIGKEAWASVPESFFGLMPILFMGHGIGGYRDYRNVGRTLRDPEGLRLLGFSEAQRQRIFDAGSERAMFKVLREEWPHRTPIVTAAAGRHEAGLDDAIQSGHGVRAMTAARLKAELETARNFHTRMQEFLREDAGSPDILRTAAGWEVRRSDGRTLTLQSPAEVQLALLSFGRARARAEAARIHREVEEIVRRDQAAGMGSEHLLRTEAQRFRREGDSVHVFALRDGAEHPLEISGSARARLHEEMNALGMDEGTIRGANYTLLDDTGRLVRRYETNAGADVSTILHERVETLYKAGQVPPPDIRAAAAHLAALPRFDPAKIKDPGQRRVAEYVRRLAGDDPALTDAARREALVELIVADGEGRFRDGTPLEPRSFLTSVRHAAMAAGGRVRSALMSVLQYLGLARRQHEGMHELIRAFNRARETGEIKPGDAWDVFAQRLREGEEASSLASTMDKSGGNRGRRKEGKSYALAGLEADRKERLHFRMFVSRVLMGDSSITVKHLSAPAWWMKLGLEDFPLQLAASRFNKITQAKHRITEQDLHQLPDELANPLAVFQSRREGDSFMVLTRLEENGLPVVVTIRRGKGVHEITSVYGKPLGVIQAHATEGTLYVNKSEVRQSTLNKRVQFPKVLSKGGRYDYITERDIVNSSEAVNQSISPVVAPEKGAVATDQSQSGDQLSPRAETNGGKTYSLAEAQQTDGAKTPNPRSKTHPWPQFLEPAAHTATMQTNEQQHPANRQTWDPRSLEEALRGDHQRGTGPAHGETRGDGSSEGDQPALSGRIDSLPEYRAAALLEGVGGLTRAHGDEHVVYLDPASGLAIKLTQPGETGKGTAWPEYLRRLTLSNELLGDHLAVAGRVRFPGEKADRVITFQPLRLPHPDRPTPTTPEIDSFMKQRGFEKAYDGVFYHRGKDMIATDALPKNFMRDPTGEIHAIDIQFREPSDRETSGFNRDRIEAMIRNSAGDNNHP